ncbi:hypothetical protein [Streptomyces sp. NPDC088847]|uniref:hypothetical protein n=1 Tax=Streptomyces sp. NPDC088847 TaxID=3365909 RepID=UPI00382524DF
MTARVRPVVTATVAERHRIERLRLDVTGAPPIEVRELGARETFHPTGLHLAYDGTETTEIRVPTAEGEELFVRLEEVPDDPTEPWIREFADDHRPDPREHDRAHAWAAVASIVERARDKGVTQIDTDLLAEALGLDEDEQGEPASDETDPHNFTAEYLSEAAAKRRLPKCSVCRQPATATAHDGDENPDTLLYRALLNA